MKKLSMTYIIKNIIMWIVSFIVFSPILLIIINAFKSDTDLSIMLFSLPEKWEFSNFSVAIEEGKLFSGFISSFIYSGGATVVTILLATMAAYLFSRRSGKVMDALYMYLILGMVIPVNYVSLMKIMQIAHLNNSRIGIILLYTAMQLPFITFLIYGFVGHVPTELDEAAVIDGSGPVRLFFTIIMPLLKGGIVTGGVLCFLNTWNEFVLPLYFLNDSNKWPMTLGVYNFFGKFETSWNLICADILLTCLPVITIYILGQRYIVEGQTAGAVKG